VEKPALAARKAKPVKQAARAASSKLLKLTQAMSETERLKLIQLLEGK
jgi:hypothetical protein